MAIDAIMIPSGLDNVPKTWNYFELNEICDGVIDCPHSTPVLADSGPLMVRTQDILKGVFRWDEAAHVTEETYESRIARAEPQYGDLLYSREGTYFGIAAEVPDGVRVCLGQRMVLIRPKPDTVYFRYLKYWLNSPQMSAHIHGFRDGSVAERLNMSTIRALPIAVPPLGEQEAIAEQLGALDEKIETNRRMNEVLEGMARAIFKAWFIDFEPVRAKAAGATHFPGMPQDVFDALPKQLVDSQIGEIPDGWEVGQLKDLISIHDSKRVPLSKKQRSERQGTFPYYGATGIIDYVDDFLFDEISVLVGEDGSVVKEDGTPFVQYVWGQYWVNNHAHVLRGKHSVTEEQLYLLLKQTKIRPFVTGAVQAKLNQTNMKSIPCVVAPEIVSDAFGQAVAPLFGSLRTNADESIKLANIRDALLPKLISGELRVGVDEKGGQT